MPRALAEAVHVLADGEEVGPAVRKLRESAVRGVGVGAQGEVPPVIVELPDERGVVGEGLGGGELSGLVVAPVAPRAAEGWEAGRGAEAGAEEGEDPGGGGEMRRERG